MKNKVDIVSVASLIAAVAGAGLYALSFDHHEIIPIFVITAIISVIMPLIAKSHRVKTDRSGKWMEIAAIVIGGFNFYCVIFALTELPIVLGYLGWVVCGFAYKAIQK